MNLQVHHTQNTRHSHIEPFYPAWVRNNRLRASDMRRLRDEAQRFEYRPLVSILLASGDPERLRLERAIDSVLAQTYPNWELCVCNDADGEYVEEALSRYEKLDGRIKVEQLGRNGNIVGATNHALSLATGEYVGVLEPDAARSPKLWSGAAWRVQWKTDS